MKIPLVGPSLNQKEQNCFGHPQIYSSIAPMAMSIPEAPYGRVNGGCAVLETLLFLERADPVFLST